MENEALIRIVAFVCIFIAVALWEMIASRRDLTVSKAGRWFNNLAIIFVDTAMIRAFIPGVVLIVAAAAAEKDWGLLNVYHIDLPVAFFLGIFFLDFVIYLQHLMFHAVPLLWRLHMVHHADLDIDVSTSLRFHPIEILLSMGLKIATVAAIGIPVGAVLAFEVILNGTAMFNHGNIRLPVQLDRWLRLLVVTPDMHRVHHSVIIRETNSNFGFNFPWWDRLFGTYRAQPAAGHKAMTIGLSQFREPEKLTLPKLLLLPFTGESGYYSINHTGSEPRDKE